jgi:integrase
MAGRGMILPVTRLADNNFIRIARPKRPQHTFRHTCTTLMLRNKADIRVIQKLLGHSTLTATQVDTRVSINDLRARPCPLPPQRKRQRIILICG